jgi:short-subunit dehydrogenase
MFYIDDLLWTITVYISGWIGLISVVTFALMFALQQLFKRLPQNLKHKYNAEWALVTGASSGIGKSLVHKLAQQGINVVLVALDDSLLSTTFSELQNKYPNLTFKKVGVNLGQEGKYMDPIVEATKDLDVALVFNNAGYICTGFFADTDFDKVRANFECNAVCALGITHHFVRKMMDRKRRGLVTFTSSAGAYLPGPTATLYSSSKAFLTNFAVTLAAEVKDVGIDVVVIHPSPVTTNFYKVNGPQLASLQSAQKAGISPDVIADEIFSSAGRLTVWDQGTVCHIFRAVNKILDWQFFAEVVTRFAFLNADHGVLASQSRFRRKKAD